MDSGGVTLHVSGAAIRTFYAALLAGTGLLIVATALANAQVAITKNPIAVQLNLELEGNVAVWYSSVVLLLAAAGAIAAARADDRRRCRLLWTVCALFFVGLSIDEMAQLHERTGRLFTQYFGTIPYLTEGGYAGYAWLIALLPLIVVFIVCVFTAIRCWSGLHRRSRHLVMSAVACWIGVLVVEFVQAQYFRWSMDRSLQGALEEGLELTGASLFVIGFIESLRGDRRASRAGCDPDAR